MTFVRDRARACSPDDRRAAGGAAHRVRGGASALRGLPRARGRGRRRRALGRTGRGSPRGQGRGRDRGPAPRGRAVGRDLRRALEGAFRGPHRARARLVGRAELPRGRRRDVSFPTDRRRGGDGHVPARRSGRAPIEEGVLVDVDAGCIVDGYCSDCTRTFAVGERLGAAAGDLRALPRGAAGRAGGGRSRACAAATRTPRRATSSRRHGLGDAFGHGLGHGVGIQIHEAPTLRPESRTCSRPGTSSPSSRGSTCRGRAASASRISCW